MEEIEQEHEASYEQQKRQLLLEWQQQTGVQNATYHRLVEALKRYERDWPERTALLVCAEHLRRSYQHKQQPFVTPWPRAEHSVYISPTLMIDTSPGMQSTTYEREITPEGLFCSHGTQGKPKFLLLEGPAGSGKSTFVWYASKEWAEGKLFPELDLLITLDLADPKVVSATCLADLIPHPDDDVREAVAGTIVHTGGKQVGILVDGLDQVPQKEQGNLFVLNILKGVPSAALPNASVLVTSRPSVAATSAILPLISSKVRISQFSQEQVEQFFSKANASNPSGILDTFHDIQTKQPVVVDFCKLPLHASMLVFLICIVGAPILETKLTTLTAIFECFIRAVLLRHVRMHYPSLGVKHLKGLEKLPCQISKQFHLLCQLAYACISDGKSVVDMETIKVFADIDPKSLDTLSLMKETSFRTRESKESVLYAFLHQSLQEFLGAQHLRMCSEETQISVVEQLVKVSPCTLVFLSGILNKRSEPVMNILAEHCKKTFQLMVLKPTAILATWNYPYLLWNAINAVYETQTVGLAHLFTTKVSLPIGTANHLHITLPSTAFVHDKVGMSKRTGTFIAQGLSCPNVTYVYLQLVSSLLEDTEIINIVKALLNTLSQVEGVLTVNLKDQPQKKLHFDLGGNRITHRGTKVICQSITKLPCNTVVLLDLQLNWQPAHTDMHAALKAVVSTTCTLYPPCLSTVNLSKNSITSDLTWYLILIITTGKHLKHVHLDQNQLGPAIPLLAAAFEINSTIETLTLSECNVQPDGVAAFGRSLQHNSTLISLDLSFNPYSAEAFTDFLSLRRSSPKSGLKEVTVSHDLTDEHEAIITEIRAARSDICKSEFAVVQAKKRDRHVQWVRKHNETLIKAEEDQKLSAHLSIQQVSAYYDNFETLMSEKNVLPLILLRGFSQRFRPQAPGQSNRTIIEDVENMSEVATVALHKLGIATEEQMASITAETRMEGTELKEMFDVLAKLCESALGYLQHLPAHEIEEIESKLNPHEMPDICPVQ